MANKTQSQLFAEFTQQIKELELKRDSLKLEVKKDAIERIEKILEETGFAIYDLFEIKKPVSGEIVVIGDVEYTISKRVTNEIKDALKSIGKNPDDYKKENLVKEFGKK